MSRGTKQRSIRVEDDLWDEAAYAADLNGSNLSDIIRDRLRQYVETHRWFANAEEELASASALLFDLNAERARLEARIAKALRNIQERQDVT